MLDTSVAVKPARGAARPGKIGLLRRAEASGIELCAPGTCNQSFQGALWWHHQREGHPSTECGPRGRGFVPDPVVLYAPEDLMPRAAEITLETGVIVYDALFLALAEDFQTVVITADGRLLKALEGTAQARLAHLLSDVDSLIPSTN